MNSFTRLGLRAALAATTMLAGTATLIAPAHAQTSTATIRGTVRDAAGAPVGATVVTATSTATGIAYTATSGSDGGYVLNGVRPGVYTITVDAADGTRFEQVVSVGIGQSATLDIALTAAESGDASTITPGTAADSGEGDIIVTGNTLRETRTSEVATNVSQAQIRRLPQTDRNFLSFAALAPGVRYNDSETDKGFSSGAQTASQVNVFIDGVSLKNKLREGGVAGQQNSRGNPFGQLAVQEFRVATQNYKAEYEQAGSAVITAITKSGTNEFHGEVFGQYTDKGLTQKAFLDRVNNRVEPAFERKQYGVALGGPIIKDKLFFFGTYEGNDQDRAFTVQSNATADQRTLFRQQTGRNVSDFEGNFVSPFRGDFYFGKLTLAPNTSDVFDLSFSRREETDIQGFGGETSFEAAENKRNKVDTYLYKWTHTGEGFVNEFNANYLNYTFNPSSLNPNLPQFQYIGIITFGGKDSTRRETQTGYTIRDDLTWTGWQGHVVKVGARVEVTDIEFNNQSFIQPRFTYGINGTGTPNDLTDDTDFTLPFEARLGLGNGRILASNTQFGAYVQDDWDITNTLQLNLGVRWDYETNGFNNEYVTPSNAAAALRAYPSTYYFNPNNYISNGRNRTPFLYAFAPRFGFSWDINDDQSTVFFGGAGRYYDRNNFNNTVDELSRRINPVGVFRFSRTGAPRNGLPTVAFNNSYLTADGLRVLAATSEQGLPELFAVKNDAKPPVNDQFSLGVRQKVGVFQASLTGSYQRGRNGYTNLFATRNNNGLGNCCNTAAAVRNGYSNILIGFDGLDTRYKALFFTLDKNYTEASGWGMNLAYTLGKAEKNGGDLFSLDGLTPDQYGWRTSPGDERHRVVLSGLVDLPFGIQFSTLTTLGSGQAYQVTDATRGFDTGQLRFTSEYPIKNCIRGVFAFCQVDLTLAKRFSIFNSNDGLELAVDVLNAFNNKNFAGFDGFFSATDPLVRTEIGTSTLTLPRRFQFRAGFRF